MLKKNLKSRSPLKAKPVRLPGQSIQEARFDLALDKVLLPMMITIMFFVIALISWVEELTGSSTSPWAWSVFFIISLAFLVFRLLKVVPLVRRLRQAEEGEIAVGQYLERLREQGYQVFHDIVGDGFNLDHVLIGPAGVFTVETKTWSKPERGEAKIKFDGQTLTAWNRQPERDPLIQARAQAGWLSALLKESVGSAAPVKPVVVFPGWFIENTAKADNTIWVLNPKALPTYLSNAPVKLEADKVSQYSFHLGRFIRRSEVERQEAERATFRRRKKSGSQIGI